MFNKNKGITLITLIITIIILLILSGISISILSGDNGIITRAKQAKEETLNAQAKEDIKIAIMNIQSKKIIEGKDFYIDDITSFDLKNNNKNIIDYDEISYEGIYMISNVKINFYINENLDVIINKDIVPEKGEDWEQLIEIIGLNPENYENKENALSNIEVLNKIKINRRALKFISKNKDLFDTICTNDNTIDDEVIKIGIVPIMTSNTTPSPFAVSSNSEFNEEFLVSNAFDQTLTKMWHTTQVKPVDLLIDMGQNTQVSSFSLTATNRPDASPKDFTIQGSNDGENWDIIKTYTNFNNYKSDETTLFVLDQTENYRYYKLNISKDNGYTYISMWKIQFYT